MAVLLVLGLHSALLLGYRIQLPRHLDTGAGNVVEIAYLVTQPDTAQRAAVSKISPSPSAIVATSPERPIARAAASSLSIRGPALEEFVDARLLTVRPAPTEFVALPQPELDDPRKSGSAVFSLFVNREGRVVRVRVDSSTLPEDVKQQAEQAFFRAGFRPGMLNGEVVASRLEIEVLFDSPSGPPGTAGRAGFDGVAHLSASEMQR